MTFKRLSPWLFTLFVILAFVAWNYYRENAEKREIVGASIEIRDGDSFVLNKESIRLDGIDAPEVKQNCISADGSIWRCGPESRRQLGLILRKGDVRCESRAKDRYGRTVATCSARDTPDVAEALVRGGFATAAARIGEGKYAAAEEEARNAKRGIWQGPFERPAQYRLHNPREEKK